MMRAIFLTGVVGLAALAAPLPAQDVGGAMDMGMLTGTLGQDHLTKSEKARANKGRAAASPDRRRQTCAKARRMAAVGNNHSKLPTLLALCRRAGY